MSAMSIESETSNGRKSLYRVAHKVSHELLW